MNVLDDEFVGCKKNQDCNSSMTCLCRSLEDGHLSWVLEQINHLESPVILDVSSFCRCHPEARSWCPQPREGDDNEAVCPGINDGNPALRVPHTANHRCYRILEQNRQAMQIFAKHLLLYAFLFLFLLSQSCVPAGMRLRSEWWFVQPYLYDCLLHAPVVLHPVIHHCREHMVVIDCALCSSAYVCHLFFFCPAYWNSFAAVSCCTSFISTALRRISSFLCEWECWHLLVWCLHVLGSKRELWPYHACLQQFN